jgi:hypothetical protein
MDSFDETVRKSQ